MIPLRHRVSFLFFGLQFSFSQDYSYHNIPEELLKNADAVVRLDEMSVVVTAQDQMHISSKRVVTDFLWRLLGSSGEFRSEKWVWVAGSKPCKPS